MLDISQFQLFVASFMWTKSLLCSFCKCLNCRVDLNSNNVNNKATDFLLSWTYHFDLFWNSYQYLIILLHAATAASSVWSEVLWCCAADRLCACAAVLQTRSYWPGSLQSVSGCMSAVSASCTAAADSFIVCFHRNMHWYSLFSLCMHWNSYLTLEQLNTALCLILRFPLIQFPCATTSRGSYWFSGSCPK